MLIQKSTLNCFKSSLRGTVAKIRNKQYVEKQTFVQGWVKSIRKLKRHTFLMVNDGSSGDSLQVVLESSLSQNIQTGSSVEVKGVLNETKNKDIEIIAEKINVVGDCVIVDGYPFAPRKFYPPEYVRKYLHFRSRTTKFSSVLRIRSNLLLEVCKYFKENDFFHIHTPIFTSNDCEGGNEVFTAYPVNKDLLKKMGKKETSIENIYFNTEVFLTVSGQLHLEAAVHGLSKVFNIGPVFRAENSKSRFHLSEFYMIEAEVAFMNEIQQLTDLVENFIKHITKNILENSKSDIAKILVKQDFSWLNKPFNKITFDEAHKILKEKKIKRSIEEPSINNFTKEEELFLVSCCGNVPTFVINWPKETKPFYMRECSSNSQKVSAMDLLVPKIGELVGGGLRENNYEKLREKIPCDIKYGWYAELRKFGGVPTGGFGLGMERYLQFILDIENIKDTIPFPRWPHNCQL